MTKLFNIIALIWKNAGKLVAIKTAIQIAWMLCVMIVANPVLKILVKKDNHIRFHNVKMADGSSMKSLDTFINFGLKGQPMLLCSDEGYILCVHGNKDGSFQIGASKLQYEEGIEYFQYLPDGDYHLFSCYNGNRTDYTSASKNYIRPEATKTNHPSIMMADGDDIIVAAGSYVSYCAAIQSLDLTAVIKMMLGKETQY